MHIHDNVCYCLCERVSERVPVNENMLDMFTGKMGARVNLWVQEEELGWCESA